MNRYQGTAERFRTEFRLVYRRLLRAFGPQGWWPAESRIEVVIGAVLTQNTSWSNVERAIASLRERRLLDLARLDRIPERELAPLIRSSGFYRLKTRRLKSVVGWLHEQGGFAALSSIPTTGLRTRLLECHGVGPETADSILLYALDRPVFVVDAYTRRILYRYGLATGGEGYAELKTLAESALPRRTAVLNECHALLVRLAKVHCRSAPCCTGCPLA